MDILPDTKLLKFHSDTLQYVRSLYGLDKPGRVDEAVDILIAWLKKQDHFVKKDLSREYLERTIIISKGSVERAKIKLDKSCTFKTLLPTFYEPIKLRKNPLLEMIIGGMLPKLTKDHYRVLVCKNSLQHCDSGILDFYRYVIMVCEYLRAHEYCNGIICIFDFSDADMIQVMKNSNLVEIRQITSIVIEGYGARMKGMHFVTASKTIDVFLSIFKQALSPKIANRIHVHRDKDTLHEHVPKDVLPKDYGGDCDTLQNICDSWIDELSSKDFMQYFEEMKLARTDEALRSQDMFNEHCSGMPGSFRRLCVD